MLKPKVWGCAAKRRVRRVDFPVPLGAERTIGGLEVGLELGGAVEGISCLWESG